MWTGTRVDNLCSSLYDLTPISSFIIRRYLLPSWDFVASSTYCWTTCFWQIARKHIKIIIIFFFFFFAVGDSACFNQGLSCSIFFLGVLEIFFWQVLPLEILTNIWEYILVTCSSHSLLLLLLLLLLSTHSLIGWIFWFVGFLFNQFLFCQLLFSALSSHLVPTFVRFFF